jgi:hypothetical protein
LPRFKDLLQTTVRGKCASRKKSDQKVLNECRRWFTRFRDHDHIVSHANYAKLQCCVAVVHQAALEIQRKHYPIQVLCDG